MARFLDAGGEHISLADCVAAVWQAWPLSWSGWTSSSPSSSPSSWHAPPYTFFTSWRWHVLLNALLSTKFALFLNAPWNGSIADPLPSFFTSLVNFFTVFKSVQFFSAAFSFGSAKPETAETDLQGLNKPLLLKALQATCPMLRRQVVLVVCAQGLCAALFRISTTAADQVYLQHIVLTPRAR